MISLSTCQPQVDPFPALAGKLDDQPSYTIPWDTITQQIPLILEDLNSYH
jgi:hypothetical protein